MTALFSSRTEASGWLSGSSRRSTRSSTPPGRRRALATCRTTQRRDLFPKAQVWIQKDEYAYYTGEAWQPGGKHGGIDPEDVDVLLRANIAGRLHLVNGDQQVIPGISVYIGGRHTWQSQYVSVATRSGAAVLASDNMYLYENLDKHIPIAQTFDREANLRAQDRMKTIAGRPDLIIPGHDPAVLTRFPKVAEGVVRID